MLKKKQIKAQFIVETVLLTFLALVGSTLILSLVKVEFLDMLMGAESLDTSPSFALVVVFSKTLWLPFLGLLLAFVFAPKHGKLASRKRSIQKSKSLSVPNTIQGTKNV